MLSVLDYAGIPESRWLIEPFKLKIGNYLPCLMTFEVRKA
jgi:hypothetical protein